MDKLEIINSAIAPDAATLQAELERADAEIERLKGEVVKWQIEAGKFGAGCPACDDIGEENERLKEALMIARRYVAGDLEHAMVPNGGPIESWPSLGAVIDKALGNEQYGQEP